MSECITFLHSGDMGDIIASMAAIKEICEKQNKKAILYLDTTGGLTCNSKEVNKIVEMQSNGFGLKFNDKNYNFLKPLIEVQDYIDRVEKFTKDLSHIDYNLNKFREAFINMEFAKKTNQNLMYIQQIVCGLPFRWNGPWLKCGTKELKKKIIIARSCRCQSAHAFFVSQQRLFNENAYFIGTDLEYDAFCDSVRLCPERYSINDCLDAAIAMNSAEYVVANSTLFFWVALGLGKPIIHELPVDIPTTYFKDAPNVRYVQGLRFFKK